MKIVVAVFVLLDIISMACTVDNTTFVVETTAWTEGLKTDLERPFGNCTAREMWKIHTTCNTPFMHGMQKKKACQSLAEQLIKCKLNLYKTKKCFEVDDIQGSFSDYFNDTVKHMCKKAGLLERPIYQIEKVKGGGTRYSFPCSISEDKYMEEFKKCNSKMQEMWKKDTADPRICREYYKTKRCQKQLLDTKCNYTGETKTSNDFFFGSYNPFCPGGVDPTSGTAFYTPFGTTVLTVMFLLAILISQQ